MGPNCQPGTLCGATSSVWVLDGTLCRAESPVPALHHQSHRVPAHRQGIVTGKKQGVKLDILDYLSEVARFFGANIHINSGLRTGEDQARAMFDNWTTTLKRGAVYSAKSLPPDKRLRMDNYYKIACETPRATAAEKQQAEASFKEEAQTIPSRHLTGDAVDLPAPQISTAMRTALEMRLFHVKEGGKRCFHLQRRDKQVIPPVDEVLRQRWQRLLVPGHALPASPAWQEKSWDLGRDPGAFLC